MENNLTILWTNRELITAEKMVFMYAHNAKKFCWWNDFTIVIWGASTELSGTNNQVQDKWKEMFESCVNMEACKACADQFDVSEKLESLSVNFKYWGEPLTTILKESGTLLTV